jgi:hypothetical protein
MSVDFYFWVYVLARIVTGGRAVTPERKSADKRDDRLASAKSEG